MVFPKGRFIRPARQWIAQHALGLRADKAEGERLGVGFPYDPVERIHQRHVILVRLLQRFFGSLAFADVAQDRLKISAAYGGDRDLHENDLSIFAHELSLEAQSTVRL